MSTLAAAAEHTSTTGDTTSGSRRIERLILAGIVAILFVFYVIYSLSRYRQYLSAGYDLGIFDQAVRAYAHFHAPIVPLKGPGYNVLGDHFHPIIATIAPLYWIWNSPCVLLIVQSALLAASIVVVYRFTRRRASAPVTLVICASYGIGWAIQAMIDFDFHEIAFAVPLLALAIDALDRGLDANTDTAHNTDRALLIYAGLLLLVREDMGMLVLILGVLRLLARHGRAKWPGIAMVVGGAAAYVLTTTVIIPHFAHGQGFAYWQYQQLGPNLPSAVGNIVIHPWHALTVFFEPWVKTQTLLYLFIPLTFLPLRSRYSLLALPLFAGQFFSSRPNLWTTHFHYAALPWLILILAMVDGAARLKILAFRPTRYLLVSWLIIVPVWLIQYDTVTPPAARRFIHGIAFRISPEIRASAEVVSMIPDNVCVASDDHLAPHLTRRDYVSLANAQYGSADFVALDFAYDSVGNFAPSPTVVYNVFAKDGYKVIYSKAGVMLMQSPNYSGASSACKPFGPGKAGKGT